MTDIVLRTKCRRMNARREDKVKIGSEEVQDVEKFVYLRATVKKDGGGTETSKQGTRSIDGEGGGAGNPREFDFLRLYLGRDFNVHSNPLGGKFDSVAILESGEGLGASGHLVKSPEVIWMSFPRFCCALHNGRTEEKTTTLRLKTFNAPKRINTTN
ncbi:uncharacterized protein LOC110051231 [Orbicella faveolata]|uniref:uncharacterized protein LOC110051231 n=1 Tax=Orbicella faveolata TaxID=48498 RepID=UPI0009E2CAB5|nr:uncharacterized protein LOC110051231 [Orbicella faveolata]